MIKLLRKVSSRERERERERESSHAAENRPLPEARDRLEKSPLACSWLYTREYRSAKVVTSAIKTYMIIIDTRSTVGIGRVAKWECDSVDLISTIHKVNNDEASS